MLLRLLSALGAAAALAAGIPALAQGAAATPDGTDEPARIYTNEDLEQLGPIPTQEALPPTPEEIERRWAFVDSVLDEAYARIDADRRHELDRRMIEAEADALDRVDSRSRYVLPYAYYGPVYGPGCGPGCGRVPGPGFKPHLGAHAPWERPNAALFRPITPIHARPHGMSFVRGRPGA